MKRILSALMLASIAGLAGAACNSQSDTSYAYGYGGGSAGVDCSAYTTCGSCTPVPGCGWCFNATGGTCASDPDQCLAPDVGEFTWDWDPSGCPGVDAGVVPLDAARPGDSAAAMESGSGSIDSASPASDTGAPGDATGQ
jgi:hypothetical protein